MKLLAKKLISGLVAASALACAPASADIISFDGLRSAGPMPAVYRDVAWERGWYYLTSAFPPFDAHSNPTRLFSDAAEKSFSFLDGDKIFKGAWFAGYYYVSFNLYNDGVRVHSSPVLEMFGEGPAQFLASGYKGFVDTVTVVGVAGAYVMDDVTFRGEVPEPGMPELFIAGMLAAAVLNVGLRKTAKPDPAVIPTLAEIDTERDNESPS